MTERLRIGRTHALPDGLDALIAESLAQGFPAVETLRRDWELGQNRFDGEGEVLLEARRSGELVGVCGLNRDPYLVDAGVGRLRHLYVPERCRRQGVGRSLVSAVLRHAQGAFERVRLRTLRDDAGAFYDALGFARTPAEAASTHAIAPPFFVSRTRPMAEPLRAFLAGRRADCAQAVAMGEHVMQLSGYLTRDAPPADFVLAGRAVVTRGDQVLVSRNRDGRHILPGGRIEPGERPEDAARRELLEETGWEVDAPRPLALVHMYCETPEPQDVGRVIYPDFLWQIFHAAPLCERADAKLAGDYELGAELMDFAEAERIVTLELERVLLRAIQSRGAP